jgi:hypothetical protein
MDSQLISIKFVGALSENTYGNQWRNIDPLIPILRSFNATFITMIPKEKESNAADKYRPISLCNVAYKIITKNIAKRLKPILQEIVSPKQGGFLRGDQS